ncbi:MAG: class III extradiol ring-cleavage dioxygenase [Aeromicrobium sp.]
MTTYSINDLDNRLTPSPLMPVLFVGHGNPMNAISDNSFTQKWHEVGEGLPDAQAIVVISAHWLTPGQTHITDAPKNPIIYDFGGFPDELYRVQYESFGDEQVAKLLAKQLVEYEAELDKQWGLDHGTWSVLKHLAPKPEVPVLQISIDYSMPLPKLYELYGRLRAMRRRGVIFIGSGNVVHALGRVKWDGGTPWDWATQFDADTAVAIRDREIGKLVDPYGSWSEARIAVPTDDHYRPMIASMSLLEDGEDIRFFNNTIDMGSVGMRSFIST